METIINHRLSHFFLLQDEEQQRLARMLSYIPGQPTREPIVELTLDEVTEIRQAFKSQNGCDEMRALLLVQQITSIEVLSMRIIEYFGLLNGIREQVEQIEIREYNAFSDGEIDPKWEIVGGSEAMGKFGILNTLDALSNNDITKHEEILKLKYEYVFAVLLKRHTEKNLHAKMQKLKTSK